MTQPRFYPQLTPAFIIAISSIAELIKVHPDYLDNTACPYSEKDLRILKDVFFKDSGDLEDDLHDDSDIPDMEKESLRLFKDMKTFKRSLSNQDTAEMATTFRTMVSLMEKILDQRERASGLKHFEVFKNFIFETLDRYLTPQQINDFLEDSNKLLHIDS